MMLRSRHFLTIGLIGLFLATASHALSRGEALAILAEEILEPSSASEPIVTRLSPAALASGIVEPQFGGPPTIDVGSISGSPQWLAVVDLFPCEMFEHDVHYVFIDDVTGFVTTFDATDWPTVDGVPFGDSDVPGERLIEVFPLVPRPRPVAPGLPGGGPAADYGDAPEGEEAYENVTGTFPCFFGTPNSVQSRPGAHALTTGLEMLGSQVSIEQDVDDPADPDAAPNLVDADSDERMFLSIDSNTAPPTAHLIYDVTLSGAAPAGDRHVNALFDFDRSGDWGGAAAGIEWAVVNQVVSVAPGLTETKISPPFDWADGVSFPTQVWLRVVLTRDPIDPGTFGAAGWDGSGAFAFGEVEDFEALLESCPAKVPPIPPPPPPPPPPQPQLGWDGTPIKLKALIVQGDDRPLDNHVKQAADTMENTLGSQGYEIADRLNEPTADAVDNAIAKLANGIRCEDRLLIYFIGHGKKMTKGGKLSLSTNETYTGAELKAALAEIEPCAGKSCETSNESCDVTVIIESCYAGQWQDEVPAPGSEGRTIITTSKADETSKFGRDGTGGEYSDQFTRAVNDPENSDNNNDGFVSPTEAHEVAKTEISPSIQTPDKKGMPCECICPRTTWRFSGVAEGGVVRFVINDVSLEVQTTLGQTAEEVAQAVAEAINDNPVLDAAGIKAAVVDATVLTNGQIEQIVIEDPGLFHEIIPHVEEVHVLRGGVPFESEPVDTTGFGGTPPYTFRPVPGGTVTVDGVVNDDLPTGLLIDSASGALFGTPPAVRDVFHVLCEVLDSEGEVVALLWWIVIIDDGTIAHFEEIHVLPVGEPIDTGPVETGELGAGPGPFSFLTGEAGTVIDGRAADGLPEGLAIDRETGALTGVLGAGTGALDVLCIVVERDTWQAVAYLWWTIIPHFTETHQIVRGKPVDTGPVDTSPFGGTPPYRFRALPAGTQTIDGNTNEDLPEGLVLDEETGRVTGSTTAAGTVFVLCEVIDANGEVVAHLWWIFRIAFKAPAMTPWGAAVIGLVLLALLGGTIRRRVLDSR